MGLGTALVVGTVVSALAAGAQAVNSHRQAEKADDARKDQARKAAEDRQKLMDREKQEDATRAQRMRRDEVRRQHAAATVSPQTHTTPIGLPEFGSYKGTTLLGGGK